MTSGYSRRQASCIQALSFFDLGQSLSAAWDVWCSSYTGASQVERLAQERLRQLVVFARQRSPYYRQLYRRVPEDECRLASLPIVAKPQLMEHFDAVMTDPDVTWAGLRRFLADPSRVGHPFRGRYAVWSTSGTTGEPGVFVHDGVALAVYDALELIRFRRLASPATLTAALLADDRYALLAATGGHFAGHGMLERLRLLNPWLAERARVFSVLESAAKIAAQLNDYQPTLLATYPTAATLLAEEQKAGRLAIRPREIWTGGERLSPGQRSLLIDAFGCVLREGYGASEFLSIAWECPGGVLHVNSDWLVLEPVDEAGRAVCPGVASHSVLLTNLVNRVQPLIRYDLGDAVTMLARPCPCGSPFPAIRVEGRCDDIVTVRSPAGELVKLLPLALTTVLEEEAGVYRFQLIQASTTQLVLVLDPAKIAAKDEQRCCDSLRRFLLAQGVPNVTLKIERRALHPHPVSGKLRRILANDATTLPSRTLSAGTVDTG